MLRFLLFVAAVWLIVQVVKLVVRSMSAPTHRQRRRGDYGVGKNPTQPPAVEFKDVQDADFEEIKEKETK